MGTTRSGAIAISFVTLALGSTPAIAERTPIVVDGTFDDWASIDAAYVDPPGDGGGSGVDFARIWVADDERFLFVRVEFGDEIDLAENNNLRIYLDTDADADTGLAIGGIGAELEWRFGDRDGFFRWDGRTSSVRFDDIRFRAGPSVTAEVFEMAFGRADRPDGNNPLLPGAEVRIVVRDVGGDQAPEPGDLIAYTFDEGKIPPEDPIPLERERPGDLRLVSWNVLNDGPWDNERPFERQVVAVMPDIVSFQEVSSHSTSETRALVESWLPDRTWAAAGNADCKTVSAYTIERSWDIGANLAVLIDARAAIGKRILVINAHLPCCENDTGREAESDAIMEFVRDAKAPGGRVSVAQGTPIVITGDLNFVGTARALRTLLTGDIKNENQYGPDFDPDWDGTALTNVITRQTGKRMAYTWRNDGSSFWPGHLDYFIYTDAAIERGRQFTVYTPEMTPQQRTQHGLFFSDSLASDHLMQTVDLRALACVGDLNDSGSVNFDDLLQLLSAWGPCEDCTEDLNEDGVVGFEDLLALLAAWGACP